MEVWHKCQVAWGLQASKVTGLRKSLGSRLALVQMVIRSQRQEPQSRGLLQVALALPRAGCYPEEMLGFYLVHQFHASVALINSTLPGFFNKSLASVLSLRMDIWPHSHLMWHIPTLSWSL